MGGAGGGNTVAGCQDAVVGGWGAAALDVAKHRGAHVVSSAGFDLVADDLPDAVEGFVPEFVFFAFAKVHGSFLGQSAFGNADDAVLLPHLESAFHCLANISDIERHFGNHGVVRTASHAGMQRNPANVAAHDFNNQNTVVGFRRGVQPVNGVGGNGHGGIKTEGVVGSVDVIVNGLGNTNDGHAVISEPLRAFECAFAANGDECVDSGIVQIGFDGF